MMRVMALVLVLGVVAEDILKFCFLSCLAKEWVRDCYDEMVIVSGYIDSKVWYLWSRGEKG